MLSQADAVLTVSAALRDHAVSLGVEPDRVHIIPNGVDPKLFQPRPRNHMLAARWGLSEGPVIGFVSGLRRWHGIDTLPALLERLIPRYKDLRLIIVGEGPLCSELCRQIEGRGLERSALFTGLLPQEEVAELICQFDVALAPYPQPQHDFYFSPLKLFEYMACGAPVVAAGLGQIAEVVRDGETGLLYRPGDLDGLTSACDRLLGDPAFGRRLGQSAAAQIRSQYTWDHNAARVEDLARSLIAARGANG